MGVCGFVCLFVFLLATFFLHSALLPSGTHYYHRDVLCFFILSQTSDLGVNAAGGFTLRSSGHLDHRRSTGEPHRATHSALFHNSDCAGPVWSIGCRSSVRPSAAVWRLSWVSCKVEKWNKAHSRASMLTSGVQWVFSLGLSIFLITKHCFFFFFFFKHLQAQDSHDSKPQALTPQTCHGKINYVSVTKCFYFKLTILLC